MGTDLITEYEKLLEVPKYQLETQLSELNISKVPIDTNTLNLI